MMANCETSCDWIHRCNPRMVWQRRRCWWASAGRLLPIWMSIAIRFSFQICFSVPDLSLLVLPTFFFLKIELNFTVKSFGSNSAHSWKLRLQFSQSDKVTALTSPVTSEKPWTVLAISIHNLGKLFVLHFRPVCNTVTQLASIAASLWPSIPEQSFGQANTDWFIRYNMVSWCRPTLCRLRKSSQWNRCPSWLHFCGCLVW